MKSRSGFTIVELLIVIVVIAILAAISIVAYNGIQDRSNDAAVQSDLSSLAKKFELFRVDDDAYPDSVADIENLKAKVTRAAYAVNPTIEYNIVPCITSGASSYAIVAVSKSGKRLYVTNSSPPKEYTGATSWVTSPNNYIAMCTSVLPGSTAIGGASSAYGNGWRAWASV